MISALLNLPFSLFLKTKFNLYKGYILLAIVIGVAVTMGLMYLKIKLLDMDNTTLTTQVIQLENKLDTYSELLEIQAQENKKELERVKFEKGLSKNVEKLKSEGKDRTVGPILSTTINELYVRQELQRTNKTTK